MKTYLVGGAVRDALLGDPVSDRDWVVVGATQAEMEAEGFRAVGREFPVFLHPHTHEEYALARTERKTAPGYRGFVVNADPDVTLEQDLVRRDLTINAMAQGEDGTLVDPFGGRQDLERRLLRHVSEAFVEDPVRILRVARFAARYAHRGFQVAPETLALMSDMVGRGEADALVPERTWQECRRALMETSPGVFVQTLRDCGALARVMPEVDALFGVPQTQVYHPEIDTGIHTIKVLEQAALLQADSETRFACLTHDLGKALTPPEVLPGHRGHESRGLPPLADLCDRLNVPNRYRRLAERVCRYHLMAHLAYELKPRTVLKVIEGVDGLRQPEDFQRYLQACEADARGRTGLERRDYSQAAYLRAARDAAAEVDVSDLTQKAKGQVLADQIRRRRISAIARIRTAWAIHSPENGGPAAPRQPDPAADR